MRLGAVNTVGFGNMRELRMVSGKGFIKFSLLALLLLSAGTSVAQDELRRTFFKDADAARAAADALDARLLSPRAYSAGADDYEDAEEGLERGRNIEYVRRKTSDAEANFKQAAETAELAKTVLAQVMKSRQDAANARAPELAREVWDKAQREFGNAIRYLERGDLKNAQKNDIEATTFYRDAELIAIKAQYLNETRQLMADAKRARVDRFAPITMRVPVTRNSPGATIFSRVRLIDAEDFGEVDRRVLEHDPSLHSADGQVNPFRGASSRF